MRTIIFYIRKLLKLVHTCGWKTGIALLLHMSRTGDWEGCTDSYVTALRLENLKKQFAALIDDFATRHPSSAGDNTGPVWVSWWQGEEAMPPVVRGCYERMKEMVPPGHPLILVTEKNYLDYVDFPPYIIELLHKHRFTLTHFSDMLRFALIEKHGGLWIDSTVWVSRPISEEIFQKRFFTLCTDNPDVCDTKRVVAGCATSWLNGGVPGSLWHSFAKELFYSYWRRHYITYDYVLIDYCFALALDGLPEVAADIRNGALPCNGMLDIEKRLNEPFEADEFRALSEATPFFKLSYKMQAKEYTEDGRLTYYGFVCQYAKKSGC